MENYFVENVFTPATVADLNYIERKSIDGRITSSLRTPGKQIVIFGHSGVGKTTLLRKALERNYEREIFTHCMAGTTFESLVVDAFDKLGCFYLSEQTTNEKNTVKASLSASYKSIKYAIESSREENNGENFQRIVGVQLTAQRLADFLGEAKACWILEDFHKMDNTEKSKLSQIMKVFMDKSVDYPPLKIIALGAVNTGREVVEYDLEMKNRISEIEVPLMTEFELREIIENGEEFLNIKFHESAKKNIIEYSNGLASICHAICLFICEESGIFSTVIGNRKTLVKKDLENGITRYMSEETDSLKHRFDVAFKQKMTKFDNTELIFRALLEYNSDGANNAELLRVIKDERSDYAQSYLTKNLAKLQTEEKGALIKFDNSSGKYSFTTPFYRTYALAYFGKRDENKIIKNSLKNSISRLAYEVLVRMQEEKFIKGTSKNSSITSIKS